MNASWSCLSCRNKLVVVIVVYGDVVVGLIAVVMLGVAEEAAAVGLELALLVLK